MNKWINRWDKYTVYAFNFKNLPDLCQFVRNSEINSRIFSNQLIFERGSEGSDLTFNGGGWYQTRDINEAIRLCEDGWHKGFDFFKSLNNDLNRRGDKRLKLPKDKNKPINILVNLSYCWETTNNAIINRGVIIQNLVYELERNGYKVNLKTFSLIECEKELSCIIVNLKNYDELLDTRKAYFAFCNASFLRRLIFRVMECSDFKELLWVQNYGFPCNAELIKKAFNTSELDIVIPQSYEIGIRGEDIFKDWKQFLIFEDLQDYFNF